MSFVIVLARIRLQKANNVITKVILQLESDERQITILENDKLNKLEDISSTIDLKSVKRS